MRINNINDGKIVCDGSKYCSYIYRLIRKNVAIFFRSLFMRNNINDEKIVCDGSKYCSYICRLIRKNVNIVGVYLCGIILTMEK